MNQKRYGLLAVLLVVVLGAAAYGYRALTENQAAEEVLPDAPVMQETAPEDSSLAPDFNVQDREGNPVSLADLRGKPVIVNFWATWCGPCRMELPEFDKAYAAYGDQVSFMMVNLTDGVEETVDGVSAFVEENGYDFPVYFDTEGSSYEPYGLNAIPVTVAIGADGTLLWQQVGALDGETLEQVISLMLEKEE